jgi:hypothetical protein
MEGEESNDESECNESTDAIYIHENNSMKMRIKKCSFDPIAKDEEINIINPKLQAMLIESC